MTPISYRVAVRKQIFIRKKNKKWQSCDCHFLSLEVHLLERISRTNGKSSAVKRRTEVMRCRILIIALINFVGQVGAIESYRQAIRHVIADLQIKTGFCLAVNTTRICKLRLLIIVQEVIAPNVRKASVKLISVVCESDTPNIGWVIIWVISPALLVSGISWDESNAV